ncbi:ubiquitin carboxyl-terminal hydrolase 5/13 [Nematocida displodere]|uniref:Ubiquitin carboxyl-terminal hydrolase 5/13 n=1 Tax=Nematocida displodere TaxID=1805483 RepID=A0A177EES4_9MICR|nr:ubiquitin carboxyl-terminal hydrolase 5/13 [Nematocida displodere]
MFSFDAFKGECSFCYATVFAEEMLFCSCRAEMCRTHADMHQVPEHIFVCVSVTGKLPDIEVKISDFGLGVEIDTATERIKDALLMPNLPPVSKLKECSHINSEAPKIGRGADRAELLACSECEVSSNTWLCLECKQSFCGREQYGIEGNGHGQKHHAKNPAHSVFVKLQSLNFKKKHCDVFCYACDQLVRDSLAFKLLSEDPGIQASPTPALTTAQIEKRLNSEIEGLRLEEPKAPEYKLLRKDGGIQNLGNTCYISSVLQSIADLVSIHRHCLDPVHPEEPCLVSECPLECFGCQLKKVLVHLPETRTEDLPGFSIGALRDTIEAALPQYTLGTQQDATEFYENLTTLFQTYDSFGHFSGLASLFAIKMRNELSCGRCKEKVVGEEAQGVVYIGALQKVSEAFAETLDVRCDCGSDQKQRKSALVSPPPVLAIGIKRGPSASPTKRTEPETSISVPTHHKKQATETLYTLVSAVIHEGTSNAGHYFAQTWPHSKPPQSDSQWRVYDDNKIGESPLMLSKAVLLFYRRA